MGRKVDLNILKVKGVVGDTIVPPTRCLASLRVCWSVRSCTVMG